MKINYLKDGFELIYNERPIIRHTPSHPFAYALEIKTKVKSWHGSFKVTENEESRTPLEKSEIIQVEDGFRIVFSKNNYKMQILLKETNNSLVGEIEECEGFSPEFYFVGSKHEGIFGGGEQYRHLNMNGEIITNFVCEHIAVVPIAQKILFKGLYREKKHSYIKTYAPMTTYVSSEKYAIRFDTYSYGIADFRLGDYAAFRFINPPKNFQVFTGNDFFDLSRKLNIDCPNNERIPDWALNGLIVGIQGGIDRTLEIVDRMEQAGIKVCGVWNQDWCGKKITSAGKQVYWNWIEDTENYPNLKENIQKLNERGIHFLGYINPYLVEDGPMYNYFKEHNMLVLTENDEVYLSKSTTFNFGMMDLTNPAVIEYLKETIIKKNMIDIGIDGWMADFGEYLPVDCKLYNGNPRLLHNEWPTLWAKANREAVDEHPRGKDVVFFTRSTSNESQKYATLMWNGDQHTDFTKDYGMGCVIPATFNLGFSGFPLVHSDIGGFITFMSLKRDKETFIRWFEMNVFSPFLRTHESINPEINAQPYDDEIMPYVKKLIDFHVQLKPYIQEQLELAKEGIPLVRPDFYDTGDFKDYKSQYAFMFGHDIFVVPVMKHGKTSQKVNLPKGNWAQFISNKEYKGETTIEVPAPLGTPVAFFRTDSKFADLFREIQF